MDTVTETPDDLGALRRRLGELDRERAELDSRIDEYRAAAAYAWNEQLEDLGSAIEEYAARHDVSVEHSSRQGEDYLTLNNLVRVELGRIDGRYSASFAVVDLATNARLADGPPSPAAVLGLIAGLLGTPYPSELQPAAEDVLDDALVLTGFDGTRLAIRLASTDGTEHASITLTRVQFEDVLPALDRVKQHWQDGQESRP